jgi:multiple sugar transport system permease protein
MRETPLGRTPVHVLAGGLAIIFLFPLVWSLVASVSPQPSTGQVVGYGLGNYVTLYDFGAGLPRFTFNSAFVSVLTVAVTLVVSTLGGYAFAKFRFPGRDALFLLNYLGLQNTLTGLSLVLALFQLPFATYMMRISFEGVPNELEESALVDGCGSFAVLVRILLPLVRPGLVTVGLFAFLAAWNDFFAPLILISDSTKLPLPLAIANLRQQTMGAIDYGATEAGVVVMAIPCLILFLLLQRHYVRGFTSGAVKG